jgi:hypothetical protein
MITLQQGTIYMGTAAPESGGGSGGDAVWGSITGTLSDQTDLQTALNAKQDTLTAGTGIDITSDVISVDGETTTEVTLATVATSGDYTDLSNKPTVDQTYDGTSANAQSGVAIAGVLGNIETLLHNLNSGS